MSGSAKCPHSGLANVVEAELVTPVLLPLPVEEAELDVVSVEAPEPGVAVLLVAVEVTGPVLWLLFAEFDGPALAGTTTPLSAISATVYVH